MKCSLLIWSIFVFANVSSASVWEAYRPLNIDYTVYEQAALSHIQSGDKYMRTTPLGSARIYNEATLPKAIGWKSMADMQARFESIRDDRFNGGYAGGI